MSGVSLQIPVLFDVSAGAVVFGQDTSGIDIFDAHLKFDVANVDSGVGGALKTQFKNIMYADAPEVFTDGSGVLFYSATSGGSAGTELATAIRNAILGQNSKLTQPSTATGDADNNNARYKNPGIPLPNYDISRNSLMGSSDKSSEQYGYASITQNYYTEKIADTGGTNFGRILIRLMATHLMGHPFAQDFIANEAEIIADISDCDITSQVEKKLLKHEDSFFSGNIDISGTTVTMKGNEANIESANEGVPIEKSKGICNTILLNLYESLLGSAPGRFDGSALQTDASGSDSDHLKCVPRKLPFEDDDTISFYFRPIVHIEVSSSGGTGLSFGNDDISGVGSDSSTGFGATTLTNLFFNPRHRWIGHDFIGNIKNASGEESAAGKGDDEYTEGQLSMRGTNLHHGMTKASGAVLFDGHVWKIKMPFS